MNKEELRQDILTRPLPKNVALILDGNGRWAKKRNMPRIFGHAEGIKTLVEISEVSQNLGLESILVYAFSTENWSRPDEEVSFLMNALIKSLATYKSRIIKRKMRVKIIGERDNLSKGVLDAINEIEDATKEFSDFTLGICFNYGGKQEIIHATKALCAKVQSGEMSIDDINVDSFNKELYTSFLNPVDLMIRTSGEVRLSNFLPWQLAYSEFVFVDTYWPDFHEEEFYKAIREYQTRNRRFGGLEKK